MILIAIFPWNVTGLLLVMVGLILSNSWVGFVTQTWQPWTWNTDSARSLGSSKQGLHHTLRNFKAQDTLFYLALIL